MSVMKSMMGGSCIQLERKRIMVTLTSPVPPDLIWAEMPVIHWLRLYLIDDGEFSVCARSVWDGQFRKGHSYYRWCWVVFFAGDFGAPSFSSMMQENSPRHWLGRSCSLLTNGQGVLLLANDAAVAFSQQRLWSVCVGSSRFYMLLADKSIKIFLVGRVCFWVGSKRWVPQHIQWHN